MGSRDGISGKDLSRHGFGIQPPKLEAAVFRVVCFDGENGKWLRCQKGPSKSDIAGFSATGAGPDHALPNGIWVSNKYYVHSLIAV